MLTLLFIIALVLAWPTFGLSLVAWFIILFFKGKSKAIASSQRHVTKDVIEPLFQERFAEFYMALDIPFFPGEKSDLATSHQCGRFIMNYLAHNPVEAGIFLRGLKRWATKGSDQLCDPVEAAEYEVQYQDKQEVHLTAYRAIEALMKQNSLPCFRGVDLEVVEQFSNAIESRESLRG